MGKYRVKSWSDFQHYKDRRPAWIKLHRSILDDYDFQSMPDASRALAPCIWLLASEYDEGEIPADHKMLAFRFRRTEKEIDEAIKPLIDRGFLHLEQDASEPLAERKQNSIPEKRREEREKEKRGSAVALPDWLPEDSWEGFLDMRKKGKAPLTERAKQMAINRLDELRKQGQDPAAVLDQSTMNGWKSLFAVKSDKPRGEYGSL